VLIGAAVGIVGGAITWGVLELIEHVTR
jgi:hypothetical protein